jgi:Rrf2 family protein
MRISAKAEYACAAMLDLAASYGEPHPVRIKAIAEAHGISQRFLVQILLQLKNAGLVASVRGASGGYQLARPPEQISLLAIIHAIENRSQEEVVPPALAGSKIIRSPVVEVLLDVWQEVHAQEQRILEAMNLAELRRRTREVAERRASLDNALSYQI